MKWYFLATGAAQMYENGVLAYVDVKILAYTHIEHSRMFKLAVDISTSTKSSKQKKKLSSLWRVCLL